MDATSETMVLASLCGDALALAAHWEYDTDRLAARHGRVTGYGQPDPGHYHAGKMPGDQTHYGDQTLVLMASLAARQGFDLDDFASRWRALFSDYAGYVDAATRRTLETFAFGEGPRSSGSASTDLAGAARIAPLVHVYRRDPDRLLETVAAQTRMTHNTSLVLDAAAFFARTGLMVLDGAGPVAAMEEAARAAYPSAPVAAWLKKGLEASGEEGVAAVARLGQTCHVEEAFPSVVALVARNPEDLAACLSECVMAGGDSAARAMLCGLIVGARVGPRGLPAAWSGGLRARSMVEAFFRTFRAGGQ